MSIRKLNILVYTGTGTTVESVRQCMLTLRLLLSPNYAVIPVTEPALLREPWPSTCALLVFPGGADLGYCRSFDGDGNRRIADYVRRGGAYLGLCAGGYYGSRRCEFEVGNGPLEVVGSRELAFFPGTCRGGAFKGFEYHSEKGARAARIKVAERAFDGIKDVPKQTTSYYNGGGVFVDAAVVKERKVEVLATYEDQLDVDGGEGDAAVVLCSVGNGKALLTGPHPEFSPANLQPQPTLPGYDDLIQKLASDDTSRIAFLRACLTKLGLEVVPDAAARLPALSPLHLTSLHRGHVTDLLCALEEVMDKENGGEYIKAEADTFQIRSESAFSVQDMQEALSTASGSEGDATGRQDKDGLVDYSAVTKVIVAHEKKLPDVALTPQFDHEKFYASLARYRVLEKMPLNWGDIMLYGDVVTSTNSLLDNNPKFMSKLPTGFTLAASTQVSGRGRGNNVWIAPPGSLIFSVVINHPAHLAATRPIVFVQYIAAIAIIEAIRSYDVGYQDLPVKLKWPNDIYALDPTDKKSYVKIGGILSQCSYCDGSYQLVLGIGINATNPRPTTSLTDLLPRASTPQLRIEPLLARILTRLEAAYAQFLRQGFSQDLEARYYRHWLHTGQAVTLEAEGGASARVLGITRDWGMLRVEETDAQGRATGKVWALQSDENSFDYWKGLVRRKT